MEQKMIAVCGLDCERCEARLATIHNDDILREKVAKEWSELNKVEITPEMINCEGCCESGVKTVYCEQLCPIRQCAVRLGCKTCADCTLQAECDTLAPILNGNDKARDNLKALKEKSCLKQRD